MVTSKVVEGEISATLSTAAALRRLLVCATGLDALRAAAMAGEVLCGLFLLGNSPARARAFLWFQQK